MTLSWLQIVRLGLVQTALGAVGVLTTATLFAPSGEYMMPIRFRSSKRSSPPGPLSGRNGFRRVNDG